MRECSCGHDCPSVEHHMPGSTFVTVSCVECPLPSLLLIIPSLLLQLCSKAPFQWRSPSLLLLPIQATPFPSRALSLWMTSGTVFSLGGWVKGTQTKFLSGCFLFTLFLPVCATLGKVLKLSASLFQPLKTGMVKKAAWFIYVRLWMLKPTKKVTEEGGYFHRLIVHSVYTEYQCSSRH